MSTRARLWPGGLVGRVTLVLLAAIVVEFVATILIFGEAERLLVRSTQAQRIAEQIVVADRVLAATPLKRRATVARQLSTHHVKLDWGGEPDLPDANSGLAGVIERIFIDWEPVLRSRELELRVPKSGRLSGGMRMDDGTWLHFRSAEPISRWHPTTQLLLSLAIVVLAVVAVAALLVHTLGAPLRALADVAGRIGFAEGQVEIEPRGPRELRRLSEALNAMQARIRWLVESRTEALIAVSHDLRTPLARLKLRVSERTPDKSAMIDDLDEMDAMLTSLLDFMRGGSGVERVPLNLASLVMTEVEREEDLGRAVSFTGEARVSIMGDPVALRRALVNLVENALKYGHRADVALHVEDGWAVLHVRDHGPGMAPAELVRATEAFYRGDTARARDTRGLGLGLAIVAQVAQMHDGSLGLENDPRGGLCVTLRLPLVPLMSPARNISLPG